MRNIFIFLNCFFILILSQVIANLSLTRFPVLVFLILFSILGTLTGVYLSFRTNDHVIPSLRTQLSSKISKKKLKYLNYSLYSDLADILNNQAKNIVKKNLIKKRQNEPKSLTRNISNLILLNENINSNERYSSIGSDELILEEYDDESLFDINEYSRNGLLGTTPDPMLDSQFNSKLETYIHEIIELMVRDFIMSWLGHLIWEKDKFSQLAVTEIKQLIECLKKRLRNLDFVKLISKDIITNFSGHYFNVKRCSNSNQKFYLNTYEKSQENEQEHLRNISEILILNIFQDKPYFRNVALRSLVREVMVFKVIYPIIEKMSEPDFINQKLINYITNKENIKNSLNHRFAHTLTYEDLIKLIKTTNDVEELKECYYKVMNELMQAIIIKDFKSKNNENTISLTNSNNQVSSGIISSGSSSFYVSFSDNTPDLITQNQPIAKSPSSDRNSKSDLLRSRDSKKYIKQLRYAKYLCQKRLNGLDGSCLEDDETFENRIKSRKILPFESILKSKNGIYNFLKFLEHDGSDALLRFWIDVERMKKIPISNIRFKYELANRIYENYLKVYNSPVREEIDKELFTCMKLFLIGNYNEDCFYKAQENVKSVLESEHYPSFLADDRYEKLIEQIDTEEKSEDFSNTIELKSNFASQKSNDQNSSIDMTKKRLNELKERLSIKLSALNAMKTNGNATDDVKRKDLLEKDIKNLQHEISSIQTHIQKTEIWCENIGKWTTNVIHASVNADENNPNDNILLFEIHVKLTDNSIENKALKENYIEGWVIYKTLKEFENLNESLNDLISSDLKDKFKKVQNKYRKSLQKKTEERMKDVLVLLDEYLKKISQDDSLTQSNALYTFLCPSRELSSKSKKSNNSNEDKFSISSIFKGSKSKEAQEDEFLDADSDLKSLDSNDSIAEPFYVLIEEVFELKGMKKLFRKSFVLFVQLTFGGTINRKIRESVYWMINDDQLTFYLKQLKDSFWALNDSDGTFSLIKYEERTKSNEDKIRTKKISRHKLSSNIPEMLQKFVGEKNSQMGVIKLFELFQNKKLNKHLFYVLLDMFVDELILNSQ